jgi:Cupin domain
MQIRRIVTGHANGKSVVVSDGPAPRSTAFKHIPGFVTTLAWETAPDISVPFGDRDPSVTATSWVPSPGGTNLMFITFPPDATMGSADFDGMAAGQESMAVLPGLAQCFEADSPGMHTTDTVDYGVLIDGEIHLELDDGVLKKLSPRDVVIQNGTRHAWRNLSDKPAVVLFVLVGARRA